MEFNIDKLIDFYRDYYKQDNELNEEGEEAAPAPSTPSPSVSSSGGGGGGGDTSTASTGKAVKKWPNTPVNRGPANQIGNTVWTDKVARGKANPIGNTVWNSGITKGPGNSSDFA